MAGNSMFSAIVHGTEKFNEVTKQIEQNVHKATVAAIKANQNKLKTAIRANLRGEPRWTYRGKSKVYSEPFQVEGTKGQVSRPRSGTPGRMSGVLYKGVGSVRKPIKIGESWVGGVGVGKNLNNFKKGTLEAKFPYFKPAVEKVEPQMAQLFDKGWDNAIHKMGGSIL